MEEYEDPREHIGDEEWLYQHGYFDKTLYGANRRLHDAVRTTFDLIRYNAASAWYWLHHALLVHVLRMEFCRHCSGYFHQLGTVKVTDAALGDDVYCEACYARTYGYDRHYYE